MVYLVKYKIFNILLSIIALSLLGCATVGMQPPRVHVVDLQVQEVKAFETVIKMALRVINVNDMEVRIKGIDCDLEINDKPFATGVSDQKTTISAHGTTLVPMIVYSSVFDVVRGIVGLKGKEKIEYKISGRIHLEGDVLTPSSVRFESGGELSLKDLTQMDR
jgi:LEA14-like dessication related protein